MSRQDQDLLGRAAAIVTVLTMIGVSIAFALIET